MVRHQVLYIEDFDRRLIHCHWMLNMLAQDHRFLYRILWTDEATFHIDGTVNQRSTRYWSRTNPRWLHEVQAQGRWLLNVWCGILSGQIIGPFFFEQTLNGERYLHFLENNLPLLLEDVWTPVRTCFFSMMVDDDVLHIIRKMFGAI